MRPLPLQNCVPLIQAPASPRTPPFPRVPTPNAPAAPPPMPPDPADAPPVPAPGPELPPVPPVASPEPAAPGVPVAPLAPSEPALPVVVLGPASIFGRVSSIAHPKEKAIKARKIVFFMRWDPEGPLGRGSRKVHLPRLRISSIPKRVTTVFSHRGRRPLARTETGAKSSRNSSCSSMRAMEWLLFAATAPVVPILAVMGAWFFKRPPTPARGVGGVACDDARSNYA